MPPVKKLFTERRDGGKPRTAEQLDTVTRNALLSLISSLIDQKWFAHTYPVECSDGGGNIVDTNRTAMQVAMAAYDVLWPDKIDRDEPPEDGRIFDLLEFSYEVLGKPEAHG